MGSRPDISYSLSVLSKYASCPRRAHWEAIKRIMRYLRHTIDHGLLYKKTDDAKLVCYTDADWAGDQENRRSMSGMITMLNTGPVSYHAQQQPVVALSTSEAEYVAASVATKEIVWLSRFLKELGVHFGDEATILCDNQSALRMIRNPEFHKRTKHIDIRYHYIRDQFEKKEFKVAYLETKKQNADPFTKALTAEVHDKFCELIGCVKIPRFMQSHGGAD